TEPYSEAIRRNVSSIPTFSTLFGTHTTACECIPQRQVFKSNALTFENFYVWTYPVDSAKSPHRSLASDMSWLRCSDRRCRISDSRWSAPICVWQERRGRR